MNAFSDAFPLQASDTQPVTEWLDELRQRVEGWAQDARAVSSEEWTRLQRSVAGSVSKERVEQVLVDFLQRVGLRQGSVDCDLLDLRERVIAYRRGLTIENYPEYLSAPPQIEL